ESAVTLFTQPDSPTRPTVWPALMSKVTPSTARISPSLVKKEVRRLLIRKSGIMSDFPPFQCRPQPGVRRTIADTGHHASITQMCKHRDPSRTILKEPGR